MSNFIQGRFDVLPPPITVLRLPAVKDAFVNAHIPTLNYGDTTDLLVGPQYESFLGFDLAALPDEEFLYVKLVLNVPGIPKEEGDILLHALDGEARWSETGVTYANRPLERRGLSSQVGGTKRIEFDIFGELHAGYALTGSSLHRFSSKESGRGPYIEVAYLDYEAFREAEAKYFPIAFTASRAEDSGFCVSWEGTCPYGESKFKLTYGLSNLFLLSYAAEPRFVLDFVSQARKDDNFTLTFAGTERSAANFALGFSAVGHGENLFGFDFVAAEFEDFALEYKADPHGNLLLSFGAQENGEHIFPVEFQAVTVSDFAIEFRSQKAGRKDFSITFSPQASGESDFVVEFLPTLTHEFALHFDVQASSQNQFGLAFGAQASGESDFVVEFLPTLTHEFFLNFDIRASSQNQFGLAFGAQASGESDFVVEFLPTLTHEFFLHFDIQASSQDQLGLAFGVQASGESDFVVELEAAPNENFPLSFAAQMDGTSEFLISFTPRQASSTEVSLEFEAMPAKSFGIEFTAQGHEVLDITLEWEALQRYFSDLRLEWVAGGSAEGEGAELVVVLHESGCLKVLDAGVLIHGILITDTDDALLEQVVLRKVEDSDGSGYDWKSHFGLK